MSRITVLQARAWGEQTKLDIGELDTDLLAHLEGEILARISNVVDTSTWVDELTTPALVQTIITKMYVSWLYDRQYSEDLDQGNAYAARLMLNAETLIEGIIDGTIVIPGTDTDAGLPAFYPNDASSAQEPTDADPSLGPNKFSMGTTF
jgi:hypothetical protein